MSPDSQQQSAESAINSLTKQLLIGFDSTDFASLLSIISKQIAKDGNRIPNQICQQFEVEILREQNAFIKNFKDFQKVIEKETDKNKEQFIQFLPITNKFVEITEQYQSTTNIEEQNKVVENLANFVVESVKNLTNNQKTTEKTGQGQLFSSAQPIEQKQLVFSPTSSLKLLIKNPYNFFVEYVLGLKPITELDDDKENTIFGTIMHDALKRFSVDFSSKDWLQQQDENQLTDHFLTLCNNVFDENNEKTFDFYLPRLKNIAKVIIQLERNAKNDGRVVFCEKYVSYQYNQKIKFQATIDRLEIDNQNKTIYIYDYKTNATTPNNNAELKGENPQLSFIANILLSGQVAGFERLKDYSVKKMMYVDIKGFDETKNEDVDLDTIFSVKTNIDELMQLVEQYIQNSNFQYTYQTDLYTSNQIIQFSRMERFIIEKNIL